MILFLVTILGADLSIHGKLELGAVYNEARRSGGNESSIGDGFFNLQFDAGCGWLAVGCDWVPDEFVCDFGERPNYHNNNWMRCDGYTMRPSLLGSVRIMAGGLRIRCGGFKASGVEELNTPVSYYLLSTPPPLMHATHYDKGAEVGWFGRHLEASASVIDGDWRMGETSVWKMHQSSANSYPSYAGNLRVKIGPLSAGASATYGDIGSYPGEKRRHDSAIGYVEFKSGVTVRPFVVGMSRNRDGNGRHSPAVDTYGYGVEAEWKGLYGTAWSMKGDGEDGEIWIGSKSMAGWSIGYGVELMKPFKIGAQVGQIGDSFVAAMAVSVEM